MIGAFELLGTQAPDDLSGLPEQTRRAADHSLSRAPADAVRAAATSNCARRRGNGAYHWSPRGPPRIDLDPWRVVGGSARV